MNLDDLISKYLDGELLEYEDNELRSELSENPVSKEVFDEAVIINSALREDAESIAPPREFILETEEKILMKIMSSYPVSKDTVYKAPKSKIRYFAAAVVAVILFSFIRFGDNFSITENYSGLGSALDVYKNILDEEIVTHKIILSNEDNPQRIAVINKTNIANRTIAETGAQSNMAVSEYTNNDNVLLAENNANAIDYINTITNETDKHEINDEFLRMNITTDNLKEASQNDFTITAPNTDIDLNQLNKISGSDGLSNYINNSIVMKLPLPGLFNNSSALASPDITITSFLGTDLIKNKEENEKRAFNHISQSLAYSFSEDDKLGVEFGYTEYSVTDVIGSEIVAENLALQQTAKNNKQKIQASGGEFNSSQGSPVFVRESYVYNHNKQLYWGAAFYERTFINTSDIALNFRLGVGSSSDGALGFGKLYAKYSIFTGFNLTVGTEGRLFAARLSSNENKEVLRKSLSLIYGFQFVF